VSVDKFSHTREDTRRGQGQKETVKCQTCDKVFGSKDALRSHVLMKHPAEEGHLAQSAPKGAPSSGSGGFSLGRKSGEEVHVPMNERPVEQAPGETAQRAREQQFLQQSAPSRPADFKSLSEPGSLWRKTPRPAPGSNFVTRVRIGGRWYKCLLDGGGVVQLGALGHPASHRQ